MQLFPLLTPAGSDSYIQYNNGGIFGGDSTFTFNDGTKDVTMQGLVVTNAIDASGDSIVFQPNTDSTTFLQVLDADGGTPIFNIDSTNERVGIGTESPSVSFHVRTTQTASYPICFENISANPIVGIQGKAATGTPGSETAINSGDALFAMGGYGYDGTSYPAFGNGVFIVKAAEGFSATEHGTKMEWYVTENGSTSNYLAMTLSDGGNLGVGISPNASYRFYMASSSPRLAIQNDTEEDSDGGSESYFLFRGEDSGGTARTQAYILCDHDGTGTNGAGNLKFYTTDTSNVSKFAFGIDSSQNVGYGTESPVGKFHIASSTTGEGLWLQELTGDNGDITGIHFKASNNTALSYWKGAILWEDDGTSSARGKIHICVDGADDAGNAAVGDADITISSGAVDVIGDLTAGTIQSDNGVSGTLELDDGSTEKITLVFTGGILTSRTVEATTGSALADWTD